MKKIIITIILSILLMIGNSQQNRSYVIYNKNGKKVSFKKTIKSLTKSNIILFGEYHDNVISHWLELEILKELLKSSNICVGAEMFESDIQSTLSQYMKGSIGFEEFQSKSRLWSNYETDYSPIVEFLKKNNIPLYATNIPRKYARMVFKNGGFSALDSLNEIEKSHIAPLPIEFDINLPQYKNMLTMMGDHSSNDIVKAQAIKDATMAYFILKNYKKNSIFFHLNGAYHSDFYEGILWYLKLKNQSIKYKTLSTVNQENVNKLEKENYNRADFIICVNSNIPKTH